MAVIRIDDDALEQNAQNMAKYTENLRRLNGNLDEVIANIGDSWKSTSGADYVARMQGYENKALKVIDVMEAMRQYIETTVTEFRELDKKAATILRQSF